MAERPSPPDDEPEITSSGVNMQDVERDARPETRVNNAGVKVAPPAKNKADMDPEEPDVGQETGTEVEKKFEEALVRLPPG